MQQISNSRINQSSLILVIHFHLCATLLYPNNKSSIHWVHHVHGSVRLGFNSRFDPVELLVLVLGLIPILTGSGREREINT
jgi:hypothetical protein